MGPGPLAAHRNPLTTVAGHAGCTSSRSAPGRCGRPCAGVAAALLTLLVLLRGLFELLDPVAPAVAEVGAGALIVFVAAAIGGVAGAWQAALAGVARRRQIVVVGAVCAGAPCALFSLVLSVAASVDPGPRAPRAGGRRGRRRRGSLGCSRPSRVTPRPAARRARPDLRRVHGRAPARRRDRRGDAVPGRRRSAPARPAPSTRSSAARRSRRRRTRTTGDPRPPPTRPPTTTATA